MNYESVKTIILSVLVAISVLLTWNLWTYQPKYETMESSNTVKEVALSSQKDIKKIVKPNMVLYHYKESHFGTNNNDEIDKTMQQVSRWSFYDVKDITNEIKDLPAFVHAKGKVEIIFPESVPVGIFKNVLNIEDKNLPKFKFNRIVIDVQAAQKEVGNVYFVNYGVEQDKAIYSSQVNAAFIKEFSKEFYVNSNRLNSYFPYKVSQFRTLFLPENVSRMEQYKYHTQDLDFGKFKNALFNDPTIVQKDFLQRNSMTIGEEYTDGSSMMTIDYENKMLFYLNPSEESDYLNSSNALLQKSIEFINGHGGWTDPYRYADIDELSQKVVFRLYNSNGFPVFNERGMSEIVLYWGQNAISKYLRPDFEIKVPLEITTVNLPSGHTVIENLEKKPGFKMELLQNLVLGYRMSIDPQNSKIITLQPSWYYLDDRGWSQITEDDFGGMNYGLE